jgi:hypothetical protein
MPIKSKFEILLPARATKSLSVAAALLCAFVVTPASAASPDLIQPDLLLPSSTWGSGPMVASLAQLIRHEGPIRGGEPKSTTNLESSPAVLLARARIGSAGHSDQTTTGALHSHGVPLPLHPADLVAGTRTTPKLDPIAYSSQPLR